MAFVKLSLNTPWNLWDVANWIQLIKTKVLMRCVFSDIEILLYKTKSSTILNLWILSLYPGFACGPSISEYLSCDLSVGLVWANQLGARSKSLGFKYVWLWWSMPSRFPATERKKTTAPRDQFNSNKCYFHCWAKQIGNRRLWIPKATNLFHKAICETI